MLALAGALALAGPARAARAEPVDVPPGYRLVWSDEFDVDGPPDPAKWGFDTSMNKTGWHNHELQYYAGPQSENAVVRDGRLRITARRQTVSAASDWGGQHYTSARLLTRGKAAWTYGYFEVRAKMPCGRGTWPAIWTLGNGRRWPDEGELDIVEHLGRAPDRVASAVHTAAGSAGRSVYGAQRLPDACTRFHRYEMLWTPDGVSFGVDGFVHLHYPRLAAAPGAWPFDAPQFLLLNLAIGGDLGGAVDDAIFPVVFEIDHVRVYQRSE
ncbi:MAG: glycoside hydrolase family 16 protein [Burkholderiales bacterium]|nr:glycoside hydrolase family 16 protein [Burkholderiales bacterium]